MRRGKHRKLEPFRAHLDRNGQRYYAASGVELRYDIFNHQWIVLEDDAPGQYRVTDGVVERSRGTFKKGQAWGRGPAPKNPPPRSTPGHVIGQGPLPIQPPPKSVPSANPGYGAYGNWGPKWVDPESPSLVGWTKPEPITYNAPDDGPDRPCSFCGHGAYQEHDDGGCNWKFDPMSGVGLCCTCPGVDYDPTKQTAPTIPSEAPEMPQEPRNWVSAPTTPSEAPGRLQTPVAHLANHWGRGTTILILLGLGPVNTLKCGECGDTWKGRLPYLGNPWRECPACSTWNYVTVTWR